MEKDRRDNRGFKKGKKHYSDGNNFGHSILKDNVLTGVLVSTGNSIEKMAVQDSYKILNRFAEELVPELEDDNDPNPLGKRPPENALTEKPKRARHFQQMKMKAKGMIFIIMNKSVSEKLSAHRLVTAILDDIDKQKVLLSRFCSRMYPIDYAVDASIENYTKYSEELVSKYFVQLPEGVTKTWNFKFKCRNNNKFTKPMFFDALLPLIPSCYHFVQYKGDMEFFIDITQHTMCLAVLSPYSEHKYYSFQKCIEQSSMVKKPQVSKEKDEDSADLAGDGRNAPPGEVEDNKSEVSERSDIDLI